MFDCIVDGCASDCLFVCLLFDVYGGCWLVVDWLVGYLVG